MSEENKTLDEERQELSALAAEADGKGMALDELSASGENAGESTAPEKADEENRDNSSVGGDSGESPSGEVADETKAATDSENADKPDADAGSEDGGANADAPKPTKEQREAARRDKSWRKLAEERAAFLREKAEFEASKIKALNPIDEGDPAQNPNALAEQFDLLAKQFEESGDFDKADEARDKANILRNMRQSQAQRAAHPAQNPQFMKAWSANIERAISEFPEMKDPDSEFGKTVKGILNDPEISDYLSRRPDGGYIAAQLANMHMHARKVPALEKQIIELKTENKELRQRLSIPESGAYDRTSEGGKSFDKMSLQQQRDYLLKEAERADAGAPSQKVFI